MSTYKLQRRGVGRHGSFPHPCVAASDEHHIPFLHAVGADLRRQFRGMLVDVPVRRECKLPVTTLRRKVEEYGLSWSVDKSEKNIDRYKRVKTVE